MRRREAILTCAGLLVGGRVPALAERTAGESELLTILHSRAEDVLECCRNHAAWHRAVCLCAEVAGRIRCRRPLSPALVQCCLDTCLTAAAGNGNRQQQNAVAELQRIGQHYVESAARRFA